MSALDWPGRKIPAREGYDVFVAGAGMAGVAAAVTAARSGLRTAIIEYFGAPGGMPTTGLLADISGQRRGDEPVVGGFALEVEAGVKRLGGIPDDRPASYDPEKLKQVLLSLLEETGVEAFFYTQLIDAIVEGDRVTHAVVASKSGIEAFEGRLFIDDTGDADLAEMAGCPFEHGREADGLVQSGTLAFKVSGIDRSLAPSDPEINDIWVKLKPDLPINHVVLCRLPGRGGSISVNMVHILRFDGTKNTELTRARFEGEKQARGILDFFRRNVPGFEHAYIDRTAEQIGVRETRRIVGDYVLTEHDVIEGRSFADEIVRCMWPLDEHNPAGVHTGITRYIDSSYGIPYRCITPKGVENLYVVGRPISSTHMANSSSRINATCIGTGHAAGCAARMAIESGSVRKVDVKVLQALLVEQGAVIRPTS